MMGHVVGPTTKEGLYALRVAGKMLRCYTLRPNRSERRLPDPNSASARLAVGMGAIVLTGDYDWRVRRADQRPSVEPLSREDPRLALDAESNP